MIDYRLNVHLFVGHYTRFNLKIPGKFQFQGSEVELTAFTMSFHPRVQWLSQTVQIDAKMGIYDYLRGRVRLAGDRPAFTIKGIDFDTALPMQTPPPVSELGVGLFPGEIEFSLAMVEGLTFSSDGDIPKALDELVRPEDLSTVIPEAGE